MNKMTDRDKIRESEQRYRLLFENMLNGFAYCKMIFDKKNNPVDFIYIEVNKKFEELTGLKDVVGKAVTKVIPGIKESNPEVFKAYGRVAMGGKPEKFELDLKPLAKLLSVSVYSSGKGYLTAVFEDIAVSNKAKEEVLLSQTMLKEAQKLAKIGSWSWDVAKDEITWSDELYEIFKRDPKEHPITGVKELSSLYTPESYALLDKAIKQALKTSEEYNIELELICTDGTHRWGETQGKAVKDEKGRVTRLYGTVQDITERKEVENSLSLQTKALQASADAIVITDTKGIIQQINNAFTALTGYVAKEAIGHNMNIIKSGKQDASYYNFFWKDILTGKITRKEIVNRRKDGSLYDEEETVTPIKNDTGQITHFISIKRDITERKNIEKKLEEREELLDEAQKVAGLGVYKTDFIKNRWESSEILDGIFGIDKDYVRSVDGWASVIHPDDREMMTEYLQNEVFAKKSGFEKEYRIVQKNSGETRWVSGLGKMTFDKQNKPLTMVGTIQDITERKKEEKIIKESENRYRTLVDVAPLCIKWFDEKGNLISVNQHGKEEHFLVGKSEEEIKNWKYMECIEEKYRDLVKKSMQEALTGGKSTEFDMEHVPGTSTGHWCHSYLVPAADDEGKVKYLLFISRDFTSEKIVEDEKNKNLEILEKFKDLTVNRELKMVELKKEVERLKGGENTE